MKKLTSDPKLLVFESQSHLPVVILVIKNAILVIKMRFYDSKVIDNVIMIELCLLIICKVIVLF